MSENSTCEGNLLGHVDSETCKHTLACITQPTLGYLFGKNTWKQLKAEAQQPLSFFKGVVVTPATVIFNQYINQYLLSFPIMLPQVIVDLGGIYSSDSFCSPLPYLEHYIFSTLWPMSPWSLVCRQTLVCVVSRCFFLHVSNEFYQEGMGQSQDSQTNQGYDPSLASYLSSLPVLFFWIHNQVRRSAAGKQRPSTGVLKKWNRNKWVILTRFLQWPTTELHWKTSLSKLC